MAFSVPTFPLAVNIWPGTANTGDAPRVATTGNLSPGRRVTLQVSMEQPNTGVKVLLAPLVELLLPKGTDVRSAQNSTNFPSDVVEVPASSGRYYIVLGVEDVGKGFSNEYRLAFIMAASTAARSLGAVSGSLSSPAWPVPYP